MEENNLIFCKLRSCIMYWRISNSWLKHVDFMVLDLIIVEISFALSVMVRSGFKGIYNINPEP